MFISSSSGFFLFFLRFWKEEKVVLHRLCVCVGRGKALQVSFPLKLVEKLLKGKQNDSLLNCHFPLPLFQGLVTIFLDYRFQTLI